MIGGIYTEITRDSWSFVPGRYTVFTNNASGDPVSISYYNPDNTLAFVRRFTYDANGNVTKIECATE